jgi:cytochrome c-type biogenesis protein CcmH/NrfG
MVDFHRAALMTRGAKCLQAKQYHQAELICQEVLKRNPKDVEALDLMAEVALSSGSARDGIPYLERAVGLQPKNARLKFNLGRLLAAQGRYSDAITRLQQGLRLDPQNSYGLALLADAYEHNGESAKARALLQPFVEAGTDDVTMGTTWVALETRAGNFESAITTAKRHLANGRVPQSMLYDLGKAYEKSNDVDNAFAAYRLANTLVPSRFDLAFYLGYLEQMMQVCSKEAMARLPRARSQSALPIFIAGRPRSGTTLVEKILNAHPQVFSVGADATLSEMTETVSADIGSTLMYPECLADLDFNDVDALAKRYLDHLTRLGRGAKRVVDKMMGMHFHLGFASLLAPRGRVIWVRRNAVDNCFACYTEYLGVKHMYTQDLRDLGITYRFYEKIMRHWQTVLDIPVLEVHYEELVSDQEAMSRRMIEFCELQWDESCLKFYDSKTIGKRSTAQQSHSYDQVRKPIYKSSVGRAKRFEKYLQPLIEALEEGERMVRGLVPLPTRLQQEPALDAANKQTV